MTNDVNHYIKELSDILSEIKDSLKGLTSNDFHNKLKDFGYEYKCVEVKGALDSQYEKVIKKVTTYTGLYVFEETSGNCLTQDVWSKFKRDMKCEGDNVPKWNDKLDYKNKIFYVGKSNHVGQRVKEHTKSASKSTYALKLNCLEKKCQSNLEYKIHIFYLESKDDNKKNAVNELVESILHHHLEPIIGSKVIT